MGIIQGNHGKYDGSVFIVETELDAAQVAKQRLRRWAREPWETRFKWLTTQSKSRGNIQCLSDDF